MEIGLLAVALVIEMQMPEGTGRYKIKVAIMSDEGDLGISHLQVSVM